MAANTGSTNTGKRNYYNVSYGKISTKMKSFPEDFSEVVETDLKARIQNVEQVDLRKKYVNKGAGEYPFTVFYDSLTGTIQSHEKFENDNGTNLNLTILDSDGDTSILQIKFYSKYAENLLNRLLNTNSSNELTFFPYAIPTEAEIDGKNRKFYNQGISLKVNGVKVEPKYKADDKELPPTEQVKVQGKATTSRDARLDFLYNEFNKVFKPSTTANVPTATPEQAFENTPRTKAGGVSKNDNLPF